MSDLLFSLPPDGSGTLAAARNRLADADAELARWDASAEELGLTTPQSVRDAVAAARYDLERIERAELERQRHE